MIGGRKNPLENQRVCERKSCEGFASGLDEPAQRGDATEAQAHQKHGTAGIRSMTTVDGNGIGQDCWFTVNIHTIITDAACIDVNDIARKDTGEVRQERRIIGIGEREGHTSVNRVARAGWAYVIGVEGAIGMNGIGSARKQVLRSYAGGIRCHRLHRAVEFANETMTARNRELHRIVKQLVDIRIKRITAMGVGKIV